MYAAEEPRKAKARIRRRRDPRPMHGSPLSPSRTAGGGEDASQLDDAERARLRRQALGWLRADVALHKKRLETGKPADRAAVRDALREWQDDPDLAGIRDSAAVAALPAEDRIAIGALWAEVAALLTQ